MDGVLAVSRMGATRSMRRAIAASVIATIRKGSAERVLRATWGRDEGALQFLQRAAVPPASTTDGYPAGIDQIGPFRSLVPGSAALALFDASNTLDLAGLTTISVPNVAALPPRPPFVGEGQPAPAVQLALGKTVLGPARKIMVLAAMTREIEEASANTAEAVIGRVLADASSAAIDLAAFDANPADATRPAGLLHNVNPIAPSAEAIKTEAMEEDLANLAAAVAAAGIDPSQVVYVAGAREATLIKLRAGSNFANTVLMSLGMPAKSVAAFSPAAVYSGYQGVPEIETRTEASFQFEDTNPAPIVDPGGTPAAPTGSVWQMEVIAIKVRSWCAWAVAPGGAQVVNGVNW
jgi:hypothetical protein